MEMKECSFYSEGNGDRRKMYGEAEDEQKSNIL